LFKRVPSGLPPVAEIFKKHVEKVRVALTKSRHTVEARNRQTVCSYKLRTWPETLTLFFSKKRRARRS
jgi:hypothetical protein